MELEKDIELAQQATAKRQANKNYQPSQEELKAIDRVLIEQAKERLNKENIIKTRD